MSTATGWRAVPSAAQDALIAAGVLVVSLGLPVLDGRTVSVAVTLWTLAACVPLLWRRRLPLLSVAATGTVTLGSLWLGAAVSPWAALVAMFSAAYHLRRDRVLLAVAAMVWMVVVAVLRGAPITPSDVLTVVGLAVLPVSLGHAFRLQAAQARERERNRVAREVHDLVGHQLSAIRLQALGSRKAGTGADEALDTIAGLAGAALGQVRALVDVLREGGAPGLSEVDELVGRMRGALIVELVRDLAAADPPKHIQAAAYRIIEEALSNVARHASAQRATIRIATANRMLTVTVEDDGQGGTESEEGNGIRGMRERARLLGGSVSAGPRDGRGWRVRATIPLDGDVS